MRLLKLFGLFVLILHAHTVTAQYMIRGEVVAEDGRMILFDIRCFGATAVRDASRDFLFEFDSTECTCYVSALGYEDQNVRLSSAKPASILLKVRKANPRALKRSMRREKRERRKRMKSYDIIDP